MSKKIKEAQKALAKATAAFVNAPASPCKTPKESNSNSFIVHPRNGGKKTSNSTDSLAIGFLSLQPETRIHIYKLVMQDTTHADLEPTGLQHPPHLKNGYHIPPLLEVCSLIRTEASMVWYSHITFVYRQDKVLFQWLHLIGPANRLHIRTVRRDHIFLSKAWAEAAIVFTHARLKDSGIKGVTEDAIEVAFWQKEADSGAGVCSNGAWVLIRGEKWAIDGSVDKEVGSLVHGTAEEKTHDGSIGSDESA